MAQGLHDGDLGQSVYKKRIRRKKLSAFRDRNRDLERPKLGRQTDMASLCCSGNLAHPVAKMWGRVAKPKEFPLEFSGLTTLYGKLPFIGTERKGS